jgi:hypothetical protein
LKCGAHFALFPLQFQYLQQCLLAADLWFFFGKRLQFHQTTLHTGSGFLRRFSVNNNIGKFGDKLF